MAAMARLWMFCCVGIACAAQNVGGNMQPPNTAPSELARQIGLANNAGAAALARRMPAAEVGDVLQQTAASPKSSARILVLDLASEYPSEGASRAILSRLEDPDLTVRSAANTQIGRIAQKSLVPEIFQAIKKDFSTPVKAALIRQIGLIGDASDVPKLQALYRANPDMELRKALELAMARLGDESARQMLLRRLSAPAPMDRVTTLLDIPYVGAPEIARNFRPVLEDRRDAAVISAHGQPQVAGRVCDFAIQALGALGIPLPFETVPVRRFTEMEIQQALQIIGAL